MVTVVAKGMEVLLATTEGPPSSSRGRIGEKQGGRRKGVEE